ncbi:MAG: metallophosphoesterase family protein [Acidobacteriaceae bacterium]
MRLLLLSDIHGNLEALEACIAAAPAHDLVVNLGDIVGYGASPNEVVEKSRELGHLFVRGNHDRAVSGLTDLKDFNPVAGIAALWTREQLSAEKMDWLRSLPHGPIQLEQLDDVQFVHGSPLDEDEYVVSADDALISVRASSASLTFFGHTHLQGAFAVNKAGGHESYPPYKTAGQNETYDFPLAPGLRYMVNPGSVGQPRDGDWRAAFALFDSDKKIVTFCRVPYALKSSQDRILAANLPARLATRLAAGR